jgi:hypothetical protein
MEPNVRLVVQRTYDYFNSTVSILRKYPPPGPNAGNGCIRGEMITYSMERSHLMILNDTGVYVEIMWTGDMIAPRERLLT